MNPIIIKEQTNKKTCEENFKILIRKGKSEGMTLSMQLCRDIWSEMVSKIDG